MNKSQLELELSFVCQGTARSVGRPLRKVTSGLGEH